MFTRIAFIAVAPLFLFANEICITPDSNVSVDYLRQFVPSSLVVENDQIKKAYNRDVIFANRFLANITKNEKIKVSIATTQTLSNLYIQDLLKKEQIDISDDIAYSYYVVNKNKFKTQETMNIMVLTFDNKKNAENYNIKTMLPKPEDKKFYKDFKVKGLSPNYTLVLNTLEPKELSKTYAVNKKYVRTYYYSKKPEKYREFKDVKITIKKLLAEKKRNEIIEKAQGK